MALRDRLARRPALTNTLTVGVIVLAAAFAAYDFRRPQPLPPGARLFYSDDDGRTTFADVADRVPPFDHNGRPAVRAYVYACPGGRPFVAYVERLTPYAVDRLRQAKASGIVAGDQEFVVAENTEVKPPGDGTWVRRASTAGLKLLDVHCPDGGTGTPESVLPDD